MKTCLLNDTTYGHLQGDDVKELKDFFICLYYAGSLGYPNVCYPLLLPRNIAGEFTDDLSKLFNVFVFSHSVFT